MTAVIDSLGPAEPGAPAEGGDVTEVASGWRLGLREFFSNKLAVAGLVILVFFVIFCYLGPMVYHANLVTVNLDVVNDPPGAGAPLGNYSDGFDVLGSLMAGGQISLEIGLLAALVAGALGTLWGAVAGLIGGWVDSLMMRIVDVFLALPFLLVVLIIGHRYGATVVNLSLILGIFSWLGPARLVRGEVLTLRVRDFVSAARVMGGSRRHLIYRHLLPNAMGTVIVNITFVIADSILALAALGYLGFGVKYPNTDWGDQISDGTNYLQDGYWWQVYPVAVCLVLLIMSFNMIGDGLRDAVDVRLRKR
ncbi:MAG TPA: ABC transporter permease [Actinocrinis sp.]